LALSLTGCRNSLVGPVSSHVLEMKGFAYTSFTADGFQQGGRRRAVERLKSQIGNDWISLNIFEYQTSSATADIAPNTTGINPLTGAAWAMSSTEADIRFGIAQARM